MERVNWIDWAKVTAITMVVFGHIPEDPDNFLIRYICTFHMPLFFFISGYLTKCRTDMKANLHKYTHSLVVPYFLYNLIFYPYWLIRYKMEHTGEFSLFDTIVKPVMGILLGQIESPVSCTVSGVTWFLIALLFMRIIIDLCNNYQYSSRWMILASLITIGIYTTSEFYDVMNNLLMKGFTRCLPFFVLGHLLKRNNLYVECDVHRHASIAIVLYAASIAIFLLTNHTDGFEVRILRTYSISLAAIFAVLSTCKLFNHLTSKTLINISTGTIMIMGLHWMLIGTINFLIGHTLGINAIHYEWYIAIFLSVVIIALIYPFIIISKKHLPIFLGK